MVADNQSLLHALELQQSNHFAEALPLLLEFTKDYPAHPIALYSLGLSLLNTGKQKEALDCLEKGVERVSGYAPLWFIYASVLQQFGRYDEAVACYGKAIGIDQKYTEALINGGALLREMYRHKEALEYFNRVLEINPDHQAALANTGILLTEFKQSELAIRMFDRLLSINPDYPYGQGLLSYERLHVCDWSDFEVAKNRIIENVRLGKRSSKTLGFMGLSDSAEDHLKCARTFADHYCPTAPDKLWSGERYQHERIRLAYVSPDLREHPVGHLMAGVIEKHDRSRFELIAISLGVDDGSRIRGRMKEAFDQFVDATGMTARQIATRMRELEVDIAVDLAGYTSDSRTEIFAWRPAPIHVNYLGYPGTLGVSYMDYILADRHVIPEEHHQYYDEKVAYLPHAYLPTDDSLVISAKTPTKLECGLPERGFVFCCFSHDYKINPPVFDVWMRLLDNVPGSVLWLSTKNELARDNLRKEAAKRNIDPSRLVFASRVPLVEDHLARYRLADIFLDTHPYNAHTTAADALMAGLPVVTFLGGAFPARVAGSLLHAVGLPELVANSLEGYETIALHLATESDYLAEITLKLRGRGGKSALFNTQQFCRGLEEAYLDMYQSHQALYGDESSDAKIDPDRGPKLKCYEGRKEISRPTELLVVVIPVYRAELNGYEKYSFEYSLAQLAGKRIVFIAPEDLDISWYQRRLPEARVRRFDKLYFASVKGYNQLLLDPVFYEEFKPCEYLLIFQTDAILLDGAIEPWLHRGFDYVGAPWPKGVEVFVNAGRFEGDFGKHVRAHVGNGGLSLRRIDKCVALLNEFEILRQVFLQSGSSEDLFFSLLGGLSIDFIIPNEITASVFSMELRPDYYYHVNGNKLPLGAHAWWKHAPEFWRKHLHTGWDADLLISEFNL